MDINNKATFKTLSILSFVVSGYFTLLLFKSSSVGLFEAIPMIAVAMIYEVSKWCLLREVVLKRHQGGMRIIIFSLWAFTTLASIIASAGYVLNQSNATKNMNLESSTAYQNELKSRDLKNDLYSTKKKELDDIIATKNQTISAMEKTRDSWPKNYITMKENAQVQINKRIGEFDNDIKAKSAELTDITNQLASPIKVTAEPLSTTGYTSIFMTLSDFMNKNDNNSKKSPYKAENMELWFYLLLGVGVEALANMFAYLSQKDTYHQIINSYSDSRPRLEPKNTETLETTTFQENENTSKKKFRLKPRLTGVVAKQKSSNLIGFKPNPKPETNPNSTNKSPFEIDEKDFEKYIKYMYEKEKNGYAPGYIDIARNINIAVEKARAIKGELNRRGMIKTVGNRTVIIR